MNNKLFLVRLLVGIGGMTFSTNSRVKAESKHEACVDALIDECVSLGSITDEDDNFVSELSNEIKHHHKITGEYEVSDGNFGLHQVKECHELVEAVYTNKNGASLKVWAMPDPSQHEFALSQNNDQHIYECQINLYLDGVETLIEFQVEAPNEHEASIQALVKVISETEDLSTTAKTELIKQIQHGYDSEDIYEYEGSNGLYYLVNSVLKQVVVQVTHENNQFLALVPEWKLDLLNK